MGCNGAAVRVPCLLSLALSLSLALALVAMASFPATSLASDDAQAERELRRAENELRRQEEQGRRDMENRERMQAEALRGQEEAIRRMEATQSRLEANSQRLAQQSADQANSYSYPRYTYIAPLAPGAVIEPMPSALPPAAPAARALPEQMRDDDVVGAISFAPLSERLMRYFGAQSGVLVVSAGPGEPFGLQDGDVLISIDGRVPLDGPHAARILRSYQPGERVKLRVQRDGRPIDLDIAAPGPG
jgi:hypothetical protein